MMSAIRKGMTGGASTLPLVAHEEVHRLFLLDKSCKFPTKPVYIQAI